MVGDSPPGPRPAWAPQGTGARDYRALAAELWDSGFLAWAARGGVAVRQVSPVGVWLGETGRPG